MEAPADSAARPPIGDVLGRHTTALLSIPGVIGTGEGAHAGKPVITVYVVKKTAELTRQIPPEIEGYPVELRETGEVTAPPR